MLRALLRVSVAAALVAVAGLPVSASAASTSSGMTVTVGSPITLQNKLLVTVPVTVTCTAPISVDPTVSFPGSVDVEIQQANGKSVSHGSGGVELDSCSPVPQTFMVQVVPDTATAPASGPFKGGQAIAQASAEICDFNFPQTCYSGSTGWVTIKL